MELSWLFFSILATTIFGISTSLYKFPAFKNQSRHITLFWTMSTSLILSLILFSNYLKLSSKIMILTATVWGISYVVLTSLQMYALKHVDTNTLFPITTTLSLVLTVIMGVILFSESLSVIHIIGILIVTLVIYSYSYKGKKIRFSKQIMPVGIGIVLLSASNKIIHNFAAKSFDIHAYQIYQYTIAVILTIIILLIAHKDELKKSFSKQTFIVGTSIGALAFFGGFFFLEALTRGPFTLITSIHSLYILIAAILGVILYKEKLTKRTLILIILSIIAVILLRIG